MDQVYKTEQTAPVLTTVLHDFDDMSRKRWALNQFVALAIIDPQDVLLTLASVAEVETSKIEHVEPTATKLKKWMSRMVDWLKQQRNPNASKKMASHMPGSGNSSRSTLLLSSSTGESHMGSIKSAASSLPVDQPTVLAPQLPIWGSSLKSCVKFSGVTVWKYHLVVPAFIDHICYGLDLDDVPSLGHLWDSIVNGQDDSGLEQALMHSITELEWNPPYTDAETYAMQRPNERLPKYAADVWFHLLSTWCHGTKLNASTNYPAEIDHSALVPPECYPMLMLWYEWYSAEFKGKWMYPTLLSEPARRDLIDRVLWKRIGRKTSTTSLRSVFEEHVGLATTSSDSLALVETERDIREWTDMFDPNVPSRWEAMNLHQKMPARSAGDLIMSLNCFLLCLPIETRHFIMYLVRFIRFDLHDRYMHHTESLEGSVLNMDFLTHMGQSMSEWVLDSKVMAKQVCQFYMKRVIERRVDPKDIDDHWKGCGDAIFTLLLIYAPNLQL